MPDAKKLRCPICQRPVVFDELPIGLFCSERCKLVDLGRWLGEEYTIPAASPPEPADADDKP